MDKDDFYLPDDCWEHIFKFLVKKEDNNSHHQLRSLSLVSRQFLSITNRLILSISIIGEDRELAFPARIFQRFTNLTSLELRHYYGDKFLCQLSGFSLNPKAFNELQDSLKIPTLTSLTCSDLSFHCNSTIMFLIAHRFPNLQLLYLNNCYAIPEEGISYVLIRCCNIRNLNLTRCYNVKLHGINFEVPKLEVLNLSYTMVDDDTLVYVILKCFRGLLELSLQSCLFVTEKGVKHVVENCTKLREINLEYCNKVHDDVVESMVSSRPSLRKIITPLSFRFNKRNKKFFLDHGCLVINGSRSSLS